MDERLDITIMKVMNGYVVFPERGPINPSVRGDDTYVFESFERLVVWLAEYFKDDD